MLMDKNYFWFLNLSKVKVSSWVLDKRLNHKKPAFIVAFTIAATVRVKKR